MNHQKDVESSVIVIFGSHKKKVRVSHQQDGLLEEQNCPCLLPRAAGGSSASCSVKIAELFLKLTPWGPNRSIKEITNKKTTFCCSLDVLTSRHIFPFPPCLNNRQARIMMYTRPFLEPSSPGWHLPLQAVAPSMLACASANTKPP
jgi:hypothetical protein